MAMLDYPIAFQARSIFGGEKKCLKPSLASPFKNLSVSPSLRYEFEQMHAEQAAQAAKDREMFGIVTVANSLQPEQAEVEYAMRAELEEKEKEKRVARCKMEQAKPPVKWTWVTQDIVLNNHDKAAPGIFYGLEFPWSEDKIVEFGPAWLTKAFHAAQTISKDNEVTQIITSQRKITAGNNGAKSLFEVKYKLNEPGVDTKLFAKLPYPMTRETKTDRISSSVRKQPMDWGEVNTYRLFEANFPFRTPKYYFGDITPETSNFALFLGRIPFAELNGPSKTRRLKPFEVEGPYDKCKDYLLKAPAVEYYTCIFDSIAKLAGLHCSGKFATEKVLEGFTDPPTFFLSQTPAPTSQHKTVVQAGYNFLSNIAKTLYPEFVQEEWFEKKYTKAMMQLNAYVKEINYWKEGPEVKHRALGHMNLNIDNAYFWRNRDGEMEIGVLDWGGFGVNNLAHKLWWSLNTSQYEMIRDHLDNLIKGALKTFRESGGPEVDYDEFKMGFMITALQNFFQMVGAIPNSLQMCKAQEFKTITSFKDRRIADDVDGKSTLRTTVNVLYNGVMMIAEMGATEYLDRWVQEVYVGQLGKTEKSDEELLG